jgi:hypothetical protein
MDGFSKDRVMILVGLAAGFGFSTDTILKGNSRFQMNLSVYLQNNLSAFFQEWIVIPEVKNKIVNLPIAKMSTASDLEYF